MTFSSPIYLWALAGMLLPLVIHLWSKKEGKTLKVASVQYLRQSNAVKARRIHIQEYVLLFLRMLSVALIAFLLAGPQINGKKTKENHLYLVEPALLETTQFKTVLDTLKKSSMKLLAPNFPDYKAGVLDTFSTPNYWELARQMPWIAADSITIFISGRQKAISGIRPQVASHINWVVFPTETKISTPLLAYQNEAFVKVYKINTEADRTILSSEKRTTKDQNWQKNATGDSLIINNNKIPVLAEKSPSVVINYVPEFEQSMQICKAHLEAIAAYTRTAINVEVVQEKEASNHKNYDLVIWLRNEKAPDVENALLQWQPNVFAKESIIAAAAPNSYNLTAELTMDTVFETNFSAKIMEILFPHKALKKLIKASDLRVVNSKEIIPVAAPKLENSKVTQASFEISHWLALIIVGVLIIERVVSKIRKQ